jgi:class 3 adenylate cyclase
MEPTAPAPVPGVADDEAARLQAALRLLKEHEVRLGRDVLALAQAPLQQRLALLARAGARPEPVPRLRQVSVLFVDVVGSTQLLQDLDAEDSHAVLDGAMRRFGDVVHQHGGHVLRFMGDGLKAAFGLPEPGDDDAERAVRAALGVLQAAQGHALQMHSLLGGRAFTVRAGVHSGPVALGAGAEDAKTLVGATVHLAARLEQGAAPGTLSISHDTWRAVRGAFEVEALAPVVAKGIAAPMLSFRVLQERSPGHRASGRGIDDVMTRLVGRASELEQLHDALRAARTGGQLVCVTVLGDAGVGKSRLRDSLLLGLPQAQHAPAALLLAQCWPDTERQPWGVLRDMLLRHLGLAGSEDPQAQRLALQARLAPGLASATPGDVAAGVDGDRSTAHAHVLGFAAGMGFADSPHLAGLLTDRVALRQQLQQASVAWLKSQAALAPLLLVLDDLHWADEASLDLVAHWRTALAGLPVCLVCLARPALLERRPAWPTQGPHTRHIALAALGAQASGELADLLLQRLTPVPPLLRRTLIERAAGNPYYMEELLCMLIDQGVIDVQGGQWQVRGETAALQRLPTTLAAVLQARLGRLDEDLRRALQQAAIVGTHFDEDTLRAVFPAALPALPALVQRGMVQGESEGTWRFHHQLLQQAAYDSVLKGERGTWHGLVATHLASRDDVPEHWTAGHFERAGDPASAAHHYTRAAVHGTARLSLSDQLNAARRALALAPQAEAALRWKVQYAAMRCCYDARDDAGADQHLAALRALADELDDDGLRTETELQAAYVHSYTHDATRMGHVVGLAERAQARGQAVALARAYGAQAWAEVVNGRAAAGQAIAARGLAVAAEAGELPPHTVTDSAGIAAWKLGDLSTGLAHIQASRRNARTRAQPASEMSALTNLAGMARTLGDHATWQQALADAYALVARTGNQRVLPLLHIRRGQLALAQGDAAAAQADARAVIEMLPADDRWFRITALLALGHAQLAAGHAAAHADARASFEAALAGSGDAGMRSEACHGLVLVDLAQAMPAQALAHARELRLAMEAPEPGDTTERPAQWLAVADALRANGDEAGAAQALAQARDELLAQAARISDVAARERFLGFVACNRRILAMAGAAGAMEPGPSATRP